MRHRFLAMALILAGSLTAPSAASAADLRPDLGMGPVTDLRIERNNNGRDLLRWSARIVNVGAGPFQLRGSRESTMEPEMSVVQTIAGTDGTSRDVATGARMYFAGDGHSHWHVRDLETTTLERLDNGVRVGTGAKHGFCFFDIEAYRLSLPGAPQSPFFRTCGTSSAALTQTMGLSVGWADVYAWYLQDQWVDITGLGAGRYRLTTHADEQDWFVEYDDADNVSGNANANNLTWVDIHIKAKGAPRIIARGPTA